MKTLKLLFLALALSLSSAIADIDDNIELLYEWGDQYVWSMQKYQYDGTKVAGFQGHGSAVWINDTTMVTACHVPNGRNEMWANANGNYGINVDLVVEFCHQWRDQAVLSVVAGARHDVAPVTFGALPERGERVYVIGYPGDFPLTVTTGWFVGKSTQITASDDEAWLLAAQAFGGNSGGAVVVIRDGKVELVGILTAGYPSGDLTMMRTLNYSQEWLASH